MGVLDASKWYREQTARIKAEAAAKNAALAAANQGVAATGDSTYSGNLNPTGAQIGSYYTSALATDPRMEAIRRNIAGQISPDVQRQITQAAAERGIATGSYGGGADQTALLRALGLTSMDLINRGIGQYAEAYSAVPKLSPESLFITPTAQAQMSLQRELERNRLTQEAQLQAQRLATERQLQQSRIASEEYRQGQTLAQQAGQFGISRADTLAGVAATNARLDSMLSRLKGGYEYGGTSAASGTGGETGWFNQPSTTSTFQYGTSYAQPYDYTLGAYGGTEPVFSWEVPGLPETPAPEIPQYWPEGGAEEYYGQSWDY